MMRCILVIGSLYEGEILKGKRERMVVRNERSEVESGEKIVWVKVRDGAEAEAVKCGSEGGTAAPIN